MKENLLLLLAFTLSQGQLAIQKFQPVFVQKTWWTGAQKISTNTVSETLCAIVALGVNKDQPFQFQEGKCIMLNSPSAQLPSQEDYGPDNMTKLHVTVERIHNGNNISELKAIQSVKSVRLYN